MSTLEVARPAPPRVPLGYRPQESGHPLSLRQSTDSKHGFHTASHSSLRLHGIRANCPCRRLPVSNAGCHRLRQFSTSHDLSHHHSANGNKPHPRSTTRQSIWTSVHDRCRRSLHYDRSKSRAQLSACLCYCRRRPSIRYVCRDVRSSGLQCLLEPKSQPRKMLGRFPRFGHIPRLHLNASNRQR